MLTQTIFRTERKGHFKREWTEDRTKVEPIYFFCCCFCCFVVFVVFSFFFCGLLMEGDFWHSILLCVLVGLCLAL